MRRQATTAELRQSLANMREAVLARLELKRSQIVEAAPTKAGQLPTESSSDLDLVSPADDKSFKGFLKSLWIRFFGEDHG